jgi:caspase domain-containing protein
MPGVLIGTGSMSAMRLAFWLGVMAVSAMMTSSAWSQQQAARVALVIGNASYPDASTPLSTTIKDARTLAEEFRRAGFAVDLKENLGKTDMQSAIAALTDKIRPGMTALFYFSGYGIQVVRQTYLIPVNAQLWTEADVRRDAISLDDVAAEMHRKGAKVKIVIIDAARRNPFERRFRSAAMGLAPIDAPENTLAIFSAAPGKLINDGPGTNSLFVGELVKELRAPNVAAEEVFNRVRVGVSRASNNEQIPWLSSSIVEQFYFGAQPSVVTTDNVTKTATPADSVKAVFEKHDLLGNLAWDCTKPASKSNLRYLHRVLDDDRVQREQMSGPTSRDWVIIIDKASEAGSNQIALSGTLTGRVAGRDLGNAPTNGIWLVEPNRLVQWEATVNGEKAIEGGRYVSNGVKVPWMYRCGG